MNVMDKDNKKVKIVTHNAGFHTDDIFAVAILSLVLEKEGKEFDIFRSRDEKIIKEGDYVVDVGGIYDDSINRFDHHQEGGAGKRENGIPYASFGLVWKRFGEDLCGNKEVADRIDKRIVQPIDAIDSGVQFLDFKVEGLRPFDVGFITASFYPTWKESPFEVDQTFTNLVLYSKILLSRIIKSESDGFESENVVLDLYKNSADKRVVVIESSLYSWNKVLSKFPEPLYAIYNNVNNNTWSMKGVRDDSSSFVYRKFLPEIWSGKRDEELEKITGVKGVVFCHNGRFMAVAKTKEAILELAKIAIES